MTERGAAASYTADSRGKDEPMDYEAELSIRERLNDDDSRDWAMVIPWESEPVPVPAQAGINPVADVVSRAVTGNLSRHDYEALCGLLLIRGIPAAECERITAYIMADRDTLIIAAYPEIHPYYLPVRGQTWGMYAA